MKRFNVMCNVGKAKYVVNYHDGEKKHKDGSEFFDIKIFKNKQKLKHFTNALLKQGYVGLSMETKRQVKIYPGGKSGWVEDLRNNASVHFIVYNDEIPTKKSELKLGWDSEPTAIMSKTAKDKIFENKCDICNGVAEHRSLCPNNFINSDAYAYWNS